MDTGPKYYPKENPHKKKGWLARLFTMRFDTHYDVSLLNKKEKKSLSLKERTRRSIAHNPPLRAPLLLLAILALFCAIYFIPEALHLW